MSFSPLCFYSTGLVLFPTWINESFPDNMSTHQNKAPVFPRILVVWASEGNQGTNKERVKAGRVTDCNGAACQCECLHFPYPEV